MTPLAVIRSYDDLADALAVERGRRGISQFNLEVAAGLQFKQVNKLEKKKKYPGKYLACWLEGLGVELLLVRRADGGVSKQTSIDKNCPSNPDTYRKLRKQIAAMGGRARARNLTRTQMREIGRKGAQKRWKRRHRPSRPIGNGARDG